jgi:hypothetical protein
MLVQAIKTDDPEQKLKIYEKIVEKDPGNSEARLGLKEARTAVAQKRAADADQARKQNDKRATEARGRTALAAAESALFVGNLSLARQKLNEAKTLGQSGSKVNDVERYITVAESRLTFRRYLFFGGAGAAVLAVIVWIVSFISKRQPYIEILSGPARGRRYPVEKDVITIGAVEQQGQDKNDIVVSDPEKTVSRLHCELHRKGEKFYVLDCDSSNGTRIDGRPVLPGRLFPLKRGSRIQLGMSCELKFGMERRKA